jgi:hypothetical protein
MVSRLRYHGLLITSLTLLAMIIVQVCSRMQHAKGTHSALTIEKLKNAEYHSEYTAGGIAKLTNGVYREKILEDSASEIVVRLTESIAFGELSWGLPAAAVILKTEPGGSGTFTNLAVVIDNEGTPENIASKFIGDRVKVQSIAIEASTIVLRTITHGPNDPMCCPILEVTRKYGLRGRGLVELPVDR